MEFLLGFFAGGISMAIFLDYEFCRELVEELWYQTKHCAGKMRNLFEKYKN